MKYDLLDKILSQAKGNYAIIVASGRGSRMCSASSSIPKQYLRIDKKNILHHCINSISQSERINKMIVVIHPDDEKHYFASLPKSCHKLLKPAYGGDTRQQSVYNGLLAISKHSPKNVLIHDAARPFLKTSYLDSLINELENHKASMLAIPLADTVKKGNSEDNTVCQTIPRNNLWRAQTPQAFCYRSIFTAHKKALNSTDCSNFTDDASIAEWYGLKVKIVKGSENFRKITTQEDLIWAKAYLESNSMKTDGSIRVGSGYDVHAFEDGESVVLCGHSIPYNKSLKGHSDADVAMHALTDAIFGALAEGDIGSHFPPSDPKWKGASSDQFLQYAVNRVLERSGVIQNVDVTIICEAPKIGPHRDAMRKTIAEIMNLDINRVSIKATTSEKLGFTGREEGIASMASATIWLPD